MLAAARAADGSEGIPLTPDQPLAAEGEGVIDNAAQERRCSAAAHAAAEDAVVDAVVVGSDDVELVVAVSDGEAVGVAAGVEIVHQRAFDEELIAGIDEFL